MMRIDSHQHFWSLARGDYGWLTPDLAPLYRDFLPVDLEPLLRLGSIARTILVQAAPTLAETQYLLDLAQQTPFVAGVVGWVDLLDPQAPSTIAELARDPLLRGIRPMLQDIPAIDWIQQPALDPALAAMRSHGLRFDALVRAAHLPALLKMMQRHPDLAVVIDHGAKPNIAAGERQEWEAGIRLIARETPACCKLSGLATEAAAGVDLETLLPYLNVLMESFGPSRLMWGSDWPVVTLACEYETWWKMTQQYLAPFDSATVEAVLGTTAARFYDIRQVG